VWGKNATLPNPPRCNPKHHPAVLHVTPRCTLHPNDSLAMEGPLSRVKSLKKSLRQSFRRIRKSRVSGKKRPIATPTSKVTDPPHTHTHTHTHTHRLQFCPFVTSGPGGQRCSGRAGGRGSDPAEDRAPVRGRLSVRRGPLPLLRRHVSTRRCVSTSWNL